MWCWKMRQSEAAAVAAAAETNFQIDYVNRHLNGEWTSQ